MLTGNTSARPSPRAAGESEWDYYAVVSPEQFAICLTASNLGYAGLYAICLVDLAQGRSWQIDTLQPLPLGRHAFRNG